MVSTPLPPEAVSSPVIATEVRPKGKAAQNEPEGIQDQGAIDFPGKEPKERFRFYFRKHWVRLVPAGAKALAWTLMLGFSSITLRLAGDPIDDDARHLILVLLGFFFVLFHMLFMRRWYAYFLHVIVVTDMKIHRLKKRYLVMDLERSVDIPSIRDIRREQHGPLQAILGYGTILLDTAQGEFRIDHAPNLTQLHDMLVVQRDKTSNGEGPRGTSNTSGMI